MEYTVDKLAIKKIKLEIKKEKQNVYKYIMEHLKENMSEKSKRLLHLSTEKGVSNWLTMLPTAEHGSELSKQQFWGSICLKYGWEISQLPTTCPCGSKFDTQHSLSCKKGGFVTIRHNDLRDLTAKILSEVCYNTEIEPTLAPLSGDLSNRTANRSNEARLDVRACGFWERGQQAFFYSRVIDPNACQYLNKWLQQCHVINENEKREYNERVLQVDHGTFTPLVFSFFGSMGRECHKFYSRLSDLLSEKCHLPKSVVANWVR